jgi:hypothetical protein
LEESVNTKDWKITVFTFMIAVVEVNARLAHSFLLNLLLSAHFISQDCWPKSWWNSRLLLLKKATRRGQDGVWSMWLRYVAWKWCLGRLELGPAHNGGSSNLINHSTFSKLCAMESVSEPIVNAWKVSGRVLLVLVCTLGK